MRNKGQRLLTSASLVALGLIVGFMITQLGSAVAGTGQQARPAVLTDAPALDEVIPQGAFVRVAEQTQPALVFIQTEQTVNGTALLGDVPEFFRRFLEEGENPPDVPDSQVQASQGSGFLISASGYIVTNAHVVSQTDINAVEVVNADNVTVRLTNDDEYEAEIVGVDIGTDLAVLKIDAGGDLPFITLGNSDQSRVGEWVMALGAPFGLTNTVSAGIISAMGRARMGGLGSPYQDFIQTDAAINRGNSGGPLVNLRGEVIGINTMIISNGMQGQFAGVGFAIPINLVKGVVDQLIEHGRTIRGWLGITMSALPPDSADAYGLDRREMRGAVQIVAVNEGEPAAVAGVREGDIVVATDEAPLKDDQDFLQRIARTPPNETITLDILRVEPDDSPTGFTVSDQSIEVTLGERPPEIQVLADSRQLTGPAVERAPRRDAELSALEERLGMALAPLTPRIAEELGYDVEGGGIVVMRVGRSGAAIRSGLREGTIIQEVNHRAIKSIEEFTAIIEQVEPGKPVVLRVRFPEGGSARIPLEIPE